MSTANTMITKQAGSASLSQMFGLEKQEIEAIAVLGFQLYEQGKMDDAEAIFNGLIALDTHVYYGYAGMGALALAEEKLEDSVRWLTRAAELNGSDPTVHANLGEALLRSGRFNEAAQQFQIALDSDPQKTDAGANRARAILSGMQVVMQELQHASVAKA